jgi:hypothetical protein
VALENHPRLLEPAARLNRDDHSPRLGLVRISPRVLFRDAEVDQTAEQQPDQRAGGHARRAAR